MISLISNGQDYRGWKSVLFRQSLDSLASELQVNHNESWAYDKDPIPINSGDDVKLYYDGTLLLTGYFHEAVSRYDARTRTFSASARSATADLVDCSAVHRPPKFRNLTILQLANKIVGPFGLSATLSSGVSAGAVFSTFVIEPGETAHEALERAARMRGLILLSAPDGNLVLSRSTVPRTIDASIQAGRNILSGSTTSSDTDRYSQYIVVGQTVGSDDWSGTKAAAPKATATDDVVLRYRPYVRIAEAGGNSSELRTRARWEARVRAGKARRATYKVRGWANGVGVWSVHTVVQVRDPYSRIDNSMMISGVELSSDKNGKIATLEVTGIGSYDVEPMTSKPPKSSKSFLGGFE